MLRILFWLLGVGIALVLLLYLAFPLIMAWTMAQAHQEEPALPETTGPDDTPADSLPATFHPDSTQSKYLNPDSK